MKPSKQKNIGMILKIESGLSKGLKQSLNLVLAKIDHQINRKDHLESQLQIHTIIDSQYFSSDKDRVMNIIL